MLISDIEESTDEVLDQEIEFLEQKEQEIPKKIIRKKKVIRCWKCRCILAPDLNNIVCPECGAEYAEKPETEAKFHLLQRSFLKNRDSKTLGKMLIIIRDISYNTICGRLKASGKYLDDEILNDKTSWVVEKMHDYYRRPNFFISISVIYYVGQVCLYPQYGYSFKQIEQNEISLNTPIDTDQGNKEQTILDHISSSFGEDILDRNIYRDHIIDQTMDYISVFLTRAYKDHGWPYAAKLTDLVYHFINNKNNRFLNNWFKGTEGALLFEHYEKFKKELKEALSTFSEVD